MKVNDYGQEIEQPMFDMDNPHCGTMFEIYADWLDDHACYREAELMRLQWGIRIDRTTRTTQAIDRIKELQQELGVRDNKRITIEIPIPGRVRTERATLYLEDPMGMYYTKMTCNIVHVEHFLDVLHQQPILNMTLMCNNTAAPGLIAKYLNYNWLRKLVQMDLNNIQLTYPQIRTLFMETAVQLQELKVSGVQRTGDQLPTDAQLKLLPIICPGLRNLTRIIFYGKTYEYI